MMDSSKMVSRLINKSLTRKFLGIFLAAIIISGSLSLSSNFINPVFAQTSKNLFVSAENPQFNNYMTGPQVIEVVIRDPNISDTGKGLGEPDVTINGKKLRMIQATDGNWYGYFSDRKQALIADSTVSLVGKGLDFGTFCSKDTDVLGFSVSGTAGIAIPIYGAGVGGQDGSEAASEITASCSFSNPKSGGAIHVVREPKQVNQNLGSSKIGQLGLKSVELWPFIQLYDFSKGGNVVIKYNRGGGPQTVTLTFDNSDQFSKLVLDREKYPRRANVHATISDLILNIDPTDEDSWTFGTAQNNPSVYYQLFNENGESDADGTAGAANIQSKLNTLMFKDNGLLKINPRAQGGTSDVLTIEDNDDSKTNGNGVKEISTISTDGGSVGAGNQPVTVTETAPNTGIFTTTDESNNSVLVITPTTERGKSATIEYNKKAQTILVGFGTATLDLDFTTKGMEWNSGEELPVILVDSDANKNTKAKEDLDVSNPDVEFIPSLSTGDPFTLGESGVEAETKIKASFLNGFTLNPSATAGKFSLDSTTLGTTTTTKVERFSDRARIIPVASSTANALVIDFKTTMGELRSTINNPYDSNTKFRGFNMFNYDIRSISENIKNANIYLLVNPTGGQIINDADGTVVNGLQAIEIANIDTLKNLINLNSSTEVSNPANLHSLLFDSVSFKNEHRIGLIFAFASPHNITTFTKPVVADFFSFGFIGDGRNKNERIAHQIVRLELSELDKNSGVFRGSLEYIMLNQFNILDAKTYNKLITIDDEVNFVLIDKMTGTSAPRVNYNDLRQDGTITVISDQQDALTHTGKVELSTKTFKPGDTIKITLTDKDLNTSVDTVEVYTVVDPSKFPDDPAVETVGKKNQGRLSDGTPFGMLLEITFGDERWVKSTVLFNGKKCSTPISGNDGLSSTGFTLIETGSSTGIFTGDFKVPSQYCSRNQGGKVVSTIGVDIGARYFDFRDASGQIARSSGSASLGGSSGTVSLDRTAYPVPFGSVNDFFDGAKSAKTTPDGKSIFPVHLTAISKNGNPQAIDAGTEEIGPGNVVIHVRIHDPDFNVSPRGEDKIAQKLPGVDYGPLKVSVTRGTNTVVLTTAGADAPRTGVITIGKDVKNGITRELGPLNEVSPESGIFQLDLPIRYTDGPASTKCPATPSNKFTPLDRSKTGITARFEAAPSSGSYCILQGDIITVEYTDTTDASGSQRRVTDSAVFDLRTGVLSSDKSVYVAGTDMILTLIDPDLDLDWKKAETYSLDLIEWDSDAATVTLGRLGGSASKNGELFDPEPFGFRETGDGTGIFQSSIQIPPVLGGNKVDPGERIRLEYTDWGPSGADFVGHDDEDILLTIHTSNFGAFIELDKKVYTWTDKVYITIVAPDHNSDSKRIDEIGNTPRDEVNISTRGHKLTQYKLVESGPDTGIFVGEVILTGFKHDADGDLTTGDVEGIDTNPRTTPKTGGGPTNGFLQASNSDGLSVSFKFAERDTVIGSAVISWNIGEIEWQKGVNLKDGTGTIRVKDPDMNLNPEAVDSFSVDVWSESDVGGIDLKVVETNEASGVFEGKVIFTTNQQSSGNRLRVSEGDFVTAKYEDHTLPSPFTKADELKLTARTFIGTIVPPLERAPISNGKIVDISGNTLETISVGKQVQIKSDLKNGRDISQKFAYIIQIQDNNKVTVALAWLEGSLAAGQTMNPALSWVPTQSGKFTATLFVWSGLDDPEPLSAPLDLEFLVS